MSQPQGYFFRGEAMSKKSNKVKYGLKNCHCQGGSRQAGGFPCQRSRAASVPYRELASQADFDKF